MMLLFLNAFAKHVDSIGLKGYLWRCKTEFIMYEKKNTIRNVCDLLLVWCTTLASRMHEVLMKDETQPIWHDDPKAKLLLTTKYGDCFGGITVFGTTCEYLNEGKKIWEINLHLVMWVCECMLHYTAQTQMVHLISVFFWSRFQWTINKIFCT